MPSPATEVVSFPLPAGAEIKNPDSAAGKVFKDVLGTLFQQEGYQRSYFGRQVENSNTIDLYIDWDSVEAHKKFISQPYYAQFAKHFGALIDGDLSMWHVNFDPHPPSSAVGAPMTEIIAHYFASDIPESDKSAFVLDLMKFKDILEENAKGYKGHAGGWVLEELEHKDVEGKAKVWLSIVGWESVEAHMTFRESESFKDNVHLIRPATKKAMVVHHTKFLQN